jgi:hypothetical protein
MSDETRPVLDAPPVDIPKDVAPPPKDKNAAALVQIAEKGILLRNLEDLMRFARTIVEGGLAPSWAFASVKDRDQGAASNKAAAAVAIAIQAGLEHGLGVLGGLQSFMVLNGRLSWTAEAAVAKIRNSGKCVPGTLDFGSDGDKENRKGWATAQRVGYPKISRREFSWKEAQQASLIGKDNWKNYPQRMFQWRAVAWLAKDLFSDVLGGFPLAEEVVDYERPAVPEHRPAPALAPPTAPDPLFDSLFGQPHSEEKGGVVASPSPVSHIASPATVATPPPFPSHAEADRAIVESEQKGLFER